MHLVAFDSSRRSLLGIMLERAPPAMHPSLIEDALARFAFDRDKLEVLRDHGDGLRSLPVAQRERLAATLAFQGASARMILELPPVAE